MADNNILGQLREFFGYPTLKAFAADWRKLTEKDKAQIKDGYRDGTLTY